MGREQEGHVHMKWTVFAVLSMAGLAACDAQSSSPGVHGSAQANDAAKVAADGPGVTVDSNGLRLSAHPVAPSAAYLVLRGDGQPMTLTNVSSAAASRVEMHESIREDGMVMMRPVEQIAIAADGEVVMRPGGLHLMIFDISDAARAAQSVPLTLTFASGARVTIDASVADLTAREGGAPADHQHRGDH